MSRASGRAAAVTSCISHGPRFFETGKGLGGIFSSFVEPPGSQPPWGGANLAREAARGLSYF